MIKYEDMYSICNGIYVSHQKKSQKPVLYVSHSKEKMEKMRHFFPLSKYRDWDRLDFILFCDFVMYSTRASSIYSLLDNLRNSEEHFKKFRVFLEILKTYKSFLKDDCLYLKEKYNNPDLDECISEFLDKKIKFTTMYILWNKKFNNSKSKSMINNIHLDKLFNLFKFINIEDIDNIKTENFDFYDRLLKEEE